MKPFISFLESLCSENNRTYISIFVEAYNTLFEMPHADTKSGDVLDFHVEDVYQKLGKEKSLEYVNDLIEKLENDESLDIPFTLPKELKHLDHPKDALKADRYSDLLNRLVMIKDNLSNNI